jgi:hypothetical protein
LSQLIVGWTLLGSSAQGGTTPPDFVTKWGSTGGGNGQFSTESGLCIDSSGNVYVADNGNNRIQKFDRNGTFLTKWGSAGTGDGQFMTPWDVAVDSLGYVVYVADPIRIHKFDSNGAFLLKWGSPGTGDGQFDLASGVAVDSSGNVYVAENGNRRIQKFDSNGNFLTKWGFGGSADGQFITPWDVAIDDSDNVYVADSGNQRIQKFNSNGTFLTKWGSGEITNPRGMGVDSFGNIYITDAGRILLFGNASFTLAANVTSLTNGDTVTLRTFAGEPAKLALLFIMAVNGSPFITKVAGATLDANGTWTLSAPVTNSLPGTTITLRTFSLDASNGVIQTNDEDILLQ